ncbi:MAG: NAD(P)-dependent oxidoreductase [Candidatus Omnitrophica bacterium]|nr:NAD(P)-dependent oxidoreductase [Candidatus Omnitrophota bacterium]
MNILITGGAGYLGSIITPTLLRKGYVVTVIDTFMFNQTSLLDCCHDKKLTVVRGDARDKDLMLTHLKDKDAIIPLACLTGAPLCEKQPKEAEEVIIDALRIILRNRKENQKIIYPTTNSGYGVGEKGKFCTEETPLRPISLYGRLKVQAEEEILKAGNGITLRLATAFGIAPRMRLDLLVNDFTYRAVTDKYIELFEAHFMRNYAHVRDIAAAFVHCLKNFEAMKNEPYNVGLSEANLSKWDLCEEIKKQVPDFNFKEVKEGKDPDQRDYIVSNEKIEKTGFKAKVTLADGIEELIKGYTVLNANRTKEVWLTNI